MIDRGTTRVRVRFTMMGVVKAHLEGSAALKSTDGARRGRPSRLFARGRSLPNKTSSSTLVIAPFIGSMESLKCKVHAVHPAPLPSKQSVGLMTGQPLLRTKKS